MWDNTLTLGFIAPLQPCMLVSIVGSILDDDNIGGGVFEYDSDVHASLTEGIHPFDVRRVFGAWGRLRRFRLVSSPGPHPSPVPTFPTPPRPLRPRT